MDPNKYRLRQAEFGTQLLTGVDDEELTQDPLAYGIHLESDEDDAFAELDKGTAMDEDVDVEELIGDKQVIDSCRDSIQNMKDAQLPALSLPQLTWFAHAFCAVNHLKTEQVLNTQIKSTDEAIFLDPQHAQKFSEWVEKAGVEFLYYHQIWLAERAFRKENWEDCQDPNNPLHITFKCIQNDLWKKDQVFYQSVIIKYLSEKNYNDDTFIHHDLTNGVATFHDFFKHDWTENLAGQEFGGWLQQNVYKDGEEEAKPTLDWLIEDWKILNACYFQVTSGPQVPQNFRDFIAKGISFQFFI